MAEDPIFAVYLEIETGGREKIELLAELQRVGFTVANQTVDVILGSEWTLGEKKIIKFARTKVSDLGFTQRPTIEQILARVIELGHNLCEPCDGPAIRLAIKDQPRDDYIWLAMEPIQVANLGFGVFCVDRHIRARGVALMSLGLNLTSLRKTWRLDRDIIFRLDK